MAITSNFANLATVTRASKKTDAGGWDFTDGGTVGTLTEYASGVAAIHPTAGLLIEEGSTNQIRNPRGEGATGATEPTNWSIPASWGAIATWSYGEEDGWPYAQVVLNGTPSNDLVISFETTIAIAAATGEDWTISAGVRLVAGDFTNIDDAVFRHREGTGAGAYVALTDSADFLSSISTTHKRFFSSVELGGGGTVAALQPQLVFGWTSGAVSLTLRFYAPQCEERSYPTSPVLPAAASPAVSTRALDYVSVSIPAGFFSEDGGTVYVDMLAAPDRISSSRAVPWAWYLGSNRRLYPYIIAPGTWRLFAWNGADIIPTVTGYTLDAGLNRHRMAVYISDANIKWAVNGDGGSTENYSITPTATLAIDAYDQLIIGSSSSTRPLNGYIKDLRYWPRELSDAEMAAIVGL